jgi:hypothetical protein
MATKLNAMLSQDSGTVTPEHDMRWNDQSAGGHAPITLTSAFATFAGASFTVTGDTSGTGTTISSISTTGRILSHVNQGTWCSCFDLHLKVFHQRLV